MEPKLSRLYLGIFTLNFNFHGEIYCGELKISKNLVVSCWEQSKDLFELEHVGVVRDSIWKLRTLQIASALHCNASVSLLSKTKYFIPVNTRPTAGHRHLKIRELQIKILFCTCFSKHSQERAEAWTHESYDPLLQRPIGLTASPPLIFIVG